MAPRAIGAHFAFPRPTRDVDVLFRILQTHLDNFTASAPVITVSLEAVPTRGSNGQTQLFQSSWKDPNRLADTLARVEALLGAERWAFPCPGSRIVRIPSGWSHF